MTNSWEKKEFIQNCGCKKAHRSGSFFNNSWRHDDVTAIVKDYQYVRRLLVFIRHFTIWIYFPLLLLSGVVVVCQFIHYCYVMMTSNYALCQSSYAYMLVMISKLFCVILVTKWSNRRETFSRGFQCGGSFEGWR